MFDRLVHGILAGGERRPIHQVELHLVLTDDTPFVVSIALLSMATSNDGIDGVIGRDLLAELDFHYRGRQGTFSLTRG